MTLPKSAKSKTRRIWIQVLIDTLGERKGRGVRGMGAAYHNHVKISGGSRVVSTQEANERAQQAEERAREAIEIAREAVEANERAQRSEERAWQVAKDNERARQAAEERARHAVEENERARQAVDERIAQIEALYKVLEARMDARG